MINSTKTPNINQIDREELANRLIKEATLQNFGRLLQILINTFTEKKYLQKLEKREGQEVQINFPALNIKINCLTFVLSKTPSDPYVRPSHNPRVEITFNTREDNIVESLIDIVSSKYTFFGVIRLLFKYFLTGKIKYKPLKRLGTTLATLRCFLIGNSKILKE